MGLDGLGSSSYGPEAARLGAEAPAHEQSGPSKGTAIKVRRAAAYCGNSPMATVAWGLDMRSGEKRRLSPRMALHIVLALDLLIVALHVWRALGATYPNEATIMPRTDAAIAAVAAHPSQRSQPTIGNFPMTLSFAVINIITVITGTATTPFITALQ